MEWPHLKQSQEISETGVTENPFLCNSDFIWLIKHAETLVRYDGILKQEFDLSSKIEGKLVILDSADALVLVDLQSFNSRKYYRVGTIKDGLFRASQGQISNSHIDEFRRSAFTTSKRLFQESKRYNWYLKDKRYGLSWNGKSIELSDSIGEISRMTGLTGSSYDDFISFDSVITQNFIRKNKIVVYRNGKIAFADILGLPNVDELRYVLRGGYVEVGDTLYKLRASTNRIHAEPVCPTNGDFAINTVIRTENQWIVCSPIDISVYKPLFFKVNWAGRITAITSVNNRIFDSKGRWWNLESGIVEATGMAANSCYSDYDDSLFIASENVLTIIHGNVVVNRWIPKVNSRIVMFKDENGNLWLGARWQLYNVYTGEVISLGASKPNGIRSVKRTVDGKWMVGTSYGLYAGNRLQELSKVAGTEDIGVRDILQLSNELTLIGSYGQGLYLLRNNKAYPILSDFSSQCKFINSFLVDSENRLWISTDDGLFVCDLKLLINHHLDREYILPYKKMSLKYRDVYIEFNGGNGGSGLIASNGMLVYPTQTGVVSIDPNLAIADLENGVKGLWFKIGEKYIHSLSNFYSLSKGVRTLRIELAVSRLLAEQDKFNISIKGPSDERIIPIQPGQSVVLSGLAAGEYTFELVGSSLQGPFVEKYYVVDIPKLWYETGLAKLLFGLSAAGLIYLMVLIRLSSLKRNERRLKQEVSKQKRELQETNDELSENIERLRSSQKKLADQIVLRSKLISFISHDAIGPLEHIKYLLRSRLLSDKNKKDTELQSVYDTIDNMSRNVGNALSWSKSQREDLVFSKEQIDLKNLVDDIILGLNLRMSLLGVTITNKLDQFEVESDEQALRFILKNLLENELKHNPSDLSIEAKNDHDNLGIRICNHSTNERLNTLKKLYSPHLQNSASVMKLEGGLGSIIILEVLEKIAGKIKLTELEQGGYAIDVLFSDPIL